MNLRRRSIYVVALASMVALSAGFVAATGFTVFSINGETTQGGGAVSLAGTAWSCQSTCLSTGFEGGSSAAYGCWNSQGMGALTGNNPSLSFGLQLNYEGGNGYYTLCQAGDFVEVFSLQLDAPISSLTCLSAASGCSDQFLVNSEIGGTSYVSQTGAIGFTQSTTSPATGSLTFDLTLTVDYYGQSAPAISSLSISVAGNF